jgi:cell division protein FtsB
MRIRRSVGESFGILAVPAITVAVVTYFLGFGLLGPQGVLTLVDTEARLSLAQAQLSQIQNEHTELAHRVALMEQPGADNDLVEELARGMLMDGAHGQVAIGRDAR